MVEDDFTYNRTWEQILHMLEKAEQKQNWHFMMIQRQDSNKGDKMTHMRNYKALEGVVNALRWTLGDRQTSKEMVLGEKKNG